MDDENERCDAVLVSIRDWNRKISIIKLVRETTGLGLAEAKDFIEHPPRIVMEGISQEEGRELRRRFYDIGAHVDLRPSSRP
jgi:large subunit ribosomal protein L7/L12